MDVGARSTKKVRGTPVRYVPEQWSGRKLGSVTRDEMMRFHATLGREYGESTANHILRLLRAMFNLARDWGMLKGDNLAARIKLFKEKKRERFLTARRLGGSMQRSHKSRTLRGAHSFRWRCSLAASDPSYRVHGGSKSNSTPARWSCR
jgi:hypothetical protein